MSGVNDKMLSASSWGSAFEDLPGVSKADDKSIDASSDAVSGDDR